MNRIDIIIVLLSSLLLSVITATVAVQMAWYTTMGIAQIVCCVAGVVSVVAALITVIVNNK